MLDEMRPGLLEEWIAYHGSEDFVPAEERKKAEEKSADPDKAIQERSAKEQAMFSRAFGSQ